MKPINEETKMTARRRNLFLIKAKEPFTGKRIMVVFLPFVFIAVGFFVIYEPPLYFVGGEDGDSFYNYAVSGHTDQDNGGNSTIEILKPEKNQLSYKYELKKGYQYQYAYAFINRSDNATDSIFLNLKKYDYMKVKIRSNHGGIIVTGFWTFVPGYTDPKDMITYRPFGHLMEVSRQFKTFEVPFQRLYTPDWWYTDIDGKENDFKSLDFSKIDRICFSNCVKIKSNVVDRVDIAEVSFHVDLVPFYLCSLLFLTSYFCLIIFISNRKNRKKITLVFQNKTEPLKDFNVKEEAIFSFIARNYNERNLGIGDIETATKLYEREIAEIIKQKTGISFRQFLNQLRISETKRLLRETDLQVSEIAFKVGYGNISHFNRVFKEKEECSPVDFRKSNSLMSEI
jgi:AraC-like DNA-binding protein